MAKYVVFRLPIKNFDDIDWMYQERNYLGFSIVTAKSKPEAKKKYFYKQYINDMDEIDILAQASLSAYLLYQDFEEEELLKKYGEKDGAVLWDITTDYYAQGFDDSYFENLSGYPTNGKYYNEKIKNVSQGTLQELCFALREYDFGVVDVVSELK
jgi:hypothetical protein